jgi:serine protease inhibitor
MRLQFDSLFMGLFSVLLSVLVFFSANQTVAQSDQTLAQAKPSRAVASSASEASNLFGFELYQQISRKPGNLFFSPFSIEATLAMTSTGAKEETLKQMYATLHITAQISCRSISRRSLIPRARRLINGSRNRRAI